MQNLTKFLIFFQHLAQKQQPLDRFIHFGPNRQLKLDLLVVDMDLTRQKDSTDLDHRYRSKHILKNKILGTKKTIF